jgi:hypothetical protein
MASRGVRVEGHGNPGLPGLSSPREAFGGNRERTRHVIKQQASSEQRAPWAARVRTADYERSGPKAR